MNSEKIFKKYGIEKGLRELLLKKGYSKLTTIQEKSIPHSLLGKDLIIASPTGTGKTLAYTIKIIQSTKPNKKLQSIIIVPSKELAHQIFEEITYFSSYKNLNIYKIYGKQKISIEKKERIEKSEILITTPGILLRYIEELNLDISDIEHLALDEADLLLKGTFKKKLEKIILTLKRKRQTFFISATITPEIVQIIKKYGKNPTKIFAGTKLDNKKIKNYVYEIESNKKLSLLHHILKYEQIYKAIIFTNRTQTAKFIWKNIKNKNYETRLLHGDLSKGKRKKILEEFKNDKFDILIATDIASRGLDFKNITHIINYNIPREPERYIHRIGRTARIGNNGIIYNLVNKKDAEKLAKIISEKGLKIIIKERPKFEEITKIKEIEN